MASMGKGAITIRVLIVLCLALVSCEAKGRGGHGGVGLRGGVRGGHGGIGLRGGVGMRGGGPGAGLGKEFNVLQFGALPGGKDDSTQAFIQAWVAACSYTASARVVIPQGVFKVAEVIFSGPCKNPNPILVQVIGTVKADSDPSNYPDRGWITISQVDGVRIFGGGTFDGQGQNMWKYDDCKADPNCVNLPSALYLENVKNARIQWINLVNAMGFHMHISDSQNIRVNRVTINSPAESPNTDGIHVSRSQTVKIGRTSIATGDDCISIGQGAMNVSVKKVTCGPGHGISVGSLGRLPNEMDVRGVLVTNCTFTGTTNGARIKTFAASGASRASAIVFDNLIMNNVQNPIIIDQFYSSDSSAKPSLVKISDVTYQNIRGTTASPVAVNLKCSKLVPCDLKFNNINLKSSGPVTSACTNAQARYTGIQVPPPCK